MGKYGWGMVNGLFVILDVFLVKFILWNGGKFLIGVVGKFSLGFWWVYRSLYGEFGMVGCGEYMYYIFL